MAELQKLTQSCLWGFFSSSSLYKNWTVNLLNFSFIWKRTKNLDTYHLASEQTQDQQYCLTEAHLLLTAAVSDADGWVQDQLWVVLPPCNPSMSHAPRTAFLIFFGMEVHFDALFLNTELAYPIGVTPVTLFFSCPEKRRSALKGERDTGRKREDWSNIRRSIFCTLDCKRSKQCIWPLKNNEVGVVFSVLCKFLLPGVESPASIPDGPSHSGTPQNWAGLATSNTSTPGKFSVLENL